MITGQRREFWQVMEEFPEIQYADMFQAVQTGDLPMWDCFDPNEDRSFFVSLYKTADIRELLPNYFPRKRVVRMTLRNRKEVQYSPDEIKYIGAGVDVDKHLSRCAFHLITEGKIDAFGRRAGIVYYLQSVDGGPIKIGQSTGAINRFLNIQNMSPVPLKVIGVESLRTRTDPSIERTRHNQFAETRLHGEWFADTPELIEHIRTLPGKIDCPIYEIKSLLRTFKG